jgi:3-oxoacyl-[acyl-carrier-protein] synthase III
MGKITAAITGVCGYLPEEVVTNEDLAKIVVKFEVNGSFDHLIHRKQWRIYLMILII